MRRRSVLALSVLLICFAGVTWINNPSGDLNAFEFRLQGENVKQAGASWVLTESPSSDPILYLEFNVKMGRHRGRGNTFHVVARPLAGGYFDLIKNDSGQNRELWEFANGKRVRLFWSCEPVNTWTTKIHAVAIEFNSGEHVKTLKQCVTLTLPKKTLHNTSGLETREAEF